MLVFENNQYWFNNTIKCKFEHDCWLTGIGHFILLHPFKRDCHWLCTFTWVPACLHEINYLILHVCAIWGLDFHPSLVGCRPFYKTLEIISWMHAALFHTFPRSLYWWLLLYRAILAYSRFADALLNGRNGRSEVLMVATTGRWW